MPYALWDPQGSPDPTENTPTSYLTQLPLCVIIVFYLTEAFFTYIYSLLYTTL